MNFPAKRILLIATRQIGDVLFVTPLLRSLRCAYPTATIDVLTYDHKQGMLHGNPDLDAIVTVAEHPDIRGYLTLLRRIARHYDLAISTLAGDRPSVYALLAGRARVGVVPPWRRQDAWKRQAMHAWTELDNERVHTVIQNLRLADLLGIPRSYEVIIPYSAGAEQVLDAKLPFPWRSEPFAALHLLPMWRYKRWTVQGWVGLVQFLARIGVKVVLTGGGGREESEYLRSATTEMPESVVNVAGMLSLAEVARMFAAARVFVGPDTAVTHLAAATGAPTVALYGPTNPLKWAPWPAGYAADDTPFRRHGTQRVGNVLLVQGSGACVPCHEEGCERHKHSHSRCLDELSGARMIAAVQEMLERERWPGVATG